MDMHALAAEFLQCKTHEYVPYFDQETVTGKYLFDVNANA